MCSVLAEQVHRDKMLAPSVFAVALQGCRDLFTQQLGLCQQSLCIGKVWLICLCREPAKPPLSPSKLDRMLRPWHLLLQCARVPSSPERWTLMLMPSSCSGAAA